VGSNRGNTAANDRGGFSKEETSDTKSLIRRTSKGLREIRQRSMGRVGKTPFRRKSSVPEGGRRALKMITFKLQGGGAFHELKIMRTRGRKTTGREWSHRSWTEEALRTSHNSNPRKKTVRQVEKYLRWDVDERRTRTETLSQDADLTAKKRRRKECFFWERGNSSPKENIRRKRGGEHQFRRD